jgi:hypothetical protein
VYLTHSRAIAPPSDSGVSSVGRGGRGRGSHSASTSGRGTGRSRSDGVPTQIEIDRCTHIKGKYYPSREYNKFSAAEKARHFQLTHPGQQLGTGPCRDTRNDQRSVASTMTDSSSTNRKRSASSAKMDISDNDNKPLFPDSDNDEDDKTDRRKSNRANTRQST